MHSLGVKFTHPEKCCPSPQKISAMIHKPLFFQDLIIMDTQLDIIFMLKFLVLVHLCDTSSGSQTDFTVLSLFLSSTFDRPWKYFHISVVLTEKQLNKHP